MHAEEGRDGSLVPDPLLSSSLLFKDMGCSQLRVFPELSLLVLVLELWHGEGRLWSPQISWGRSPTIAGALLLPQRLLDPGAVAPAVPRLPQLLPQATGRQQGWRGSKPALKCCW